jgi:hypothetical protein
MPEFGFRQTLRDLPSRVSVTQQATALSVEPMALRMAFTISVVTRARLRTMSHRRVKTSPRYAR